MSKRFLNSDIWDKEEFLSSDSESKLLFFYVITRCNNIGVFDISLRMVSFQVGFEVTKEKILNIPSDIEEIKEGVFWLPKFCFHQYGELTENCIPHRKYIAELKKLNLLGRVNVGYSKGSDTLEEKEEEKEEDKDKDKEEEISKIKRFTKPSLEEIKAYCEQRQNKVNPNKFLNFYESKGWKVGKDPMKDWEACIRTWELKENTQSKRGSLKWRG